MPARSAAQRRLMAAAEHGAKFPMAKKIRASMTHEQMRDFAKTSERNLPRHVKHASNPGRIMGRAVNRNKMEGKAPPTQHAPGNTRTPHKAMMHMGVPPHGPLNRYGRLRHGR